MIKYGVIGTELLYDDLQHWDSLYIAGRMQKPVLMLKDYAKLPMARKNNLDAAVTMALLLLPQQFTLQVLLHAAMHLPDAQYGAGKVLCLVSIQNTS